MNFLKISGLAIGTSSVVGCAGAGVYYSVNSKNHESENIEKSNQKTKFDGKLVFEKKDDSTDNYEIKFLKNDEYTNKLALFDSDKTEDNKKYSAINKVIDLSYELNIPEAKIKLKEIFGDETTLENAKNKIETDKTKLEDLFGEVIYTSLKTKFNS